MIQVSMTVSESTQRFALSLAEQRADVAAGIESQIVTSTDPDYVGPYTVTPTEATQTLATNNTRMSGNVTINPIPSNYGKITWDGLTLTVS